MNALTEIPLPLTPHAFDARVAQMAVRGHREVTCYAAIDGAELEWTAFFETEDDPDGGINSRHEVCTYTRCKLVGAWAENGDTGALYAGNRDEVLAMIGEKAVRQWEAYAEEMENE